jgi:hypothetical protein
LVLPILPLVLADEALAPGVGGDKLRPCFAEHLDLRILPLDAVKPTKIVLLHALDEGGEVCLGILPEERLR